MKKKIRWRPLLIMLFITLLTVPIAWAANNYMSLQQAFEKMTKPETTVNVHATTTNQGQTEQQTASAEFPPPTILTDTNELMPFSVLLLGVDEREQDVGRSDTMIVVTVNPQLGTLKMLSIPRDTRTYIVGHGTTEKINHAYAHGGISMAINTVEHFLNVPIDFYVKVNMEGFLSLIDTFNGVTVDNDLALTYKNYHFPEGQITLSGEEALVFSRIRYEDPRGDFGRQTRQRLLIEAVLAEAQQPTTVITKLDEMFEVLGNNVSMNFSATQLIELIKHYGDFDRTIEQIQLQGGHGETIDDLWYYIADEQEVQEVRQKLLQHLAAH